MGRGKSNSKHRLELLYNNLIWLKSNSVNEWKDKISNFSNEEIDSFSELFLNFLKGRFKTNSRKLSKLAKIKDKIVLLASKKISRKKKVSLLSSVQGLFLIKELIPIVIDILPVYF